MDELKEVMEGLDADEERWAILLKKIDVNDDGKVGSSDKISEEEFLNYIKLIQE